jgi:hypothetical protein
LAPPLADEGCDLVSPCRLDFPNGGRGVLELPVGLVGHGGGIIGRGQPGGLMAQLRDCGLG